MKTASTLLPQTVINHEELFSYLTRCFASLPRTALILFAQNGADILLADLVFEVEETDKPALRRQLEQIQRKLHRSLQKALFTEIKPGQFTPNILAPENLIQCIAQLTATRLNPQALSLPDLQSRLDFL